MSNGEQDFDSRLDEFEALVGLPPLLLQGESEVHQLLSLPGDVIGKYSPQMADEAAFILHRYGLYLQRVLNREQAKVRRAEENIKRILAREMPRIQAYSYEERRALAVVNNERAREWDNQRLNSLAKADMLLFLSQKVHSLAGVLENIQRRKI